MPHYNYKILDLFIKVDFFAKARKIVFCVYG